MLDAWSAHNYLLDHKYLIGVGRGCFSLINSESPLDMTNGYFDLCIYISCEFTNCIFLFSICCSGAYGLHLNTSCVINLAGFEIEELSDPVILTLFLLVQYLCRSLR